MDSDATRRFAVPSSPAGEIMSRRDAFSVYNISRIRELIRHLTPKKYDLFQQIPVWLHVNRPDVPGFSKNPQVPFGIYRFHESGFWKQELSRRGLSGKDLRPFLSPFAYIQGIYLMGSSGTLAQTESSDFDYWIVIDDKEMSPEQKNLLLEKLRDIETCCRNRYQQAATFFILDAAQARMNHFSLMDEESSGSAQRTFLKEEFYRTFILVAGKVPYWAVLPAGLSDQQYRNRIEAASKERHFRFIADDFIDLGNLAVLDRKETRGALLWQVFKARKEPLKSLIKAALIAHYAFSTNEGFLCDAIKTRYFEKSPGGDLLWDPYVLMFEKSLGLFRDLEDQEGLTLLRESIFLRLNSDHIFSKSFGGTPREVLLRQYVSQWGWDEHRTRHLENYREWPEAEKLLFERKIFEKISFLYEMILRGKDPVESAIDMTERDLRVLTNRIAAHYRREPGKIPRCSSFLENRRQTLHLMVTGEVDEKGAFVWSAREQRNNGKNILLFESPDLLQTSAWLILNGFYTSRKAGIIFHVSPLCHITGNQARRFVQKVYDFFSAETVAEISPDSPSRWAALLICLYDPATNGTGGPNHADFLIMNTWGEFFFDSLKLDAPIINPLTGYRIAEHIWMFAKSRPFFNIPYHMLMPAGRSPFNSFCEIVERYLDQFRQNLMDLNALVPAEDAGQPNRPDSSLLLDK